MSDFDPKTEPEFWAVRNSLMPATAEMDRAASLLDTAVDMVLAGRDDEAITLIRQADIKALFDVRDQAVCAAPVFNVHRLRKVTNVLPKVPKDQRASTFRSESPLGEEVFRRDGWRCRYCGCRVIPAKVRRRMDERLPGVIRWHGTNIKCHAGFWALWGTVDHVIPHARGGRNEAENLVTACMVCNFAREDFTLEELGLADPRSRPPVVDGWDGLTRLCVGAARHTRQMPAKTRTVSSLNDDAVEDRALMNKRSGALHRSPRLTPAEYYAQLAHLPISVASLQVFLTSLGEVGVEAEFVKSIVLRFPIGGKELGSAGSILTSGRMFCADAYYYAQKHGQHTIGERYLAAIADLADGQVRVAGREYPEVFGRDGLQISIAALLPKPEPWRTAIGNFVRGMRAAFAR